MPKITEAAGGEYTTWGDGLAFPAFDTANAAARDVYWTAETIRTADAVFEGKEVRKPFDTPAAAGSDQSDATPLTKGQNNVTDADGAKGVTLPAATAGDEVVIVNTVNTENLLVYPVYGGSAAINALAANIAFTMLPGERMVFFAESATQWRTHGLRTARGMHTTVAASDTIVTGLNTVIAAVANLESDPVDDPQFVTAVVGDQAGTPAAGSILLKSWQNTAGNDPTPAAATTFSKLASWIAVGY